MADLYTLDDSLRRTEIIDVYESLIWTERYAAYGDFELVIRSDRGTRALLPVGTRVVKGTSKRVMTVETVENTFDDDGVALLKVNGRSLEILLEDRVATPGMSGTAVSGEKWAITGLPANIARFLFNEICVDAINSPNDILPFYTPGTLLPPGNIAEPSTSIDVALEIDTLYNSIKKICDVYHLGFRILRNEDESELYFDVYTGSDRTTLQSTLPAVVFAPELDNLSDTSELTSSANLKTVAYVIAPNGAAYVYAPGYDSASATGFSRKVLYVDASDITEAAGPTLQAALQQRGQEELSKFKNVVAFDGEIPQFGSYTYEVDYNLGDLIEMRNQDGLSTNMRVEEQIFISDATGEKSYPTFVTELLITPGSWLSWDASEVWDDADGTWDEA